MSQAAPFEKASLSLGGSPGICVTAENHVKRSTVLRPSFLFCKWVGLNVSVWVGVWEQVWVAVRKSLYAAFSPSYLLRRPCLPVLPRLPASINPSRHLTAIHLLVVFACVLSSLRSLTLQFIRHGLASRSHLCRLMQRAESMKSQQCRLYSFCPYSNSLVLSSSFSLSSRSYFQRWKNTRVVCVSGRY